MRKTMTKVSAADAPFIYFEGATCFGACAGAIQVELGAKIFNATADGSVATDVVTVAHLRCSPAAATSLRDAIDQALALAMAETAASEMVPGEPAQAPEKLN
jgi:hypothetical protein